MVEQIDNTNLRKEMSEQTATGNASWNASSSKYAGLGVTIAAELMIDFWFGIGVILAVGVVDSLNCAGVLTSSGNK